MVEGKETTRNIETETDLSHNRLKLVTAAQAALGTKEYEVCIQHLWSIVCTVDVTSTPRKELDFLIAETSKEYQSMVARRDLMHSRMRILEGNDFFKDETETIEFVIALKFYKGVLDVLLRWDLIPDNKS